MQWVIGLLFAHKGSIQPLTRRQATSLTYSTGRLACGYTLRLALIRTHFKLPADPWAVVINGAQMSLSIESRTPAIVETDHGFSSPAISFDMLFGNPGISDKHHLKSAAAGLTGGTAYL